MCDRLPLPEHGATMAKVSRSCSKLYVCRRREGPFRDPDLAAASRDEAGAFCSTHRPEVTPILLSLDMLREFGLVMNVDLAYCYSTKLRCGIPVTVLTSGHLALALTPSGNFETTGEMTTLVDEADADMAAAGQEDPLE